MECKTSSDSYCNPSLEASVEHHKVQALKADWEVTKQCTDGEYTNVDPKNCVLATCNKQTKQSDFCHLNLQQSSVNCG